MSCEFLKTDVSPSRLGHVILTSVFVAVAALMFLPKIIVFATEKKPVRASQLTVGDEIAMFDNAHDTISNPVVSVSPKGAVVEINSKHIFVPNDKIVYR